MPRETNTRLGITSVLLAAALVASGCQNGRSVAAFCSTMDKYKSRYLAQMDSAQKSDAFTGSLGAIAAIGDLNTMWRELADVAPEEIKADTEAVRDSWEKSSGQAIGGQLLSGIAASMMSANSLARIDDFDKKNCSTK